jgi:hypothetical protein
MNRTLVWRLRPPVTSRRPSAGLTPENLTSFVGRVVLRNGGRRAGGVEECSVGSAMTENSES